MDVASLIMFYSKLTKVFIPMRLFWSDDILFVETVDAEYMSQHGTPVSSASQDRRRNILNLN